MAVKPIKHIINTALILSLALGASIAAAAETDITAVTIDGRQVLLKADNTWEFIEVTQGDPSVSAVLTVSRIWDMDKACKLQFQNQHPGASPDRDEQGGRDLRQQINSLCLHKADERQVHRGSV